MKHPLFGFPHISKTGGTTILTILRSSFGSTHCDVESWLNKRDNFTPEDLERLLKVYPHLQSISGHALRPHESCETVRPIKYFAMFREPISRCISEYQHQIEMRGRDWTFEHYIERVGFNNQTRYVCGAADHQQAIEVIESQNVICGLLECFDESLLMFNQLVFEGKLNCSYAIKKAAKKNSIRSEILSDPAKMELIKQNNAEDIKLYEYIKNVRYPSQKKTCGSSLETELANFNPSSFNQRNIFLNRLYRNTVYKPALWLHRRGSKNQTKK